MAIATHFTSRSIQFHGRNPLRTSLLHSLLALSLTVTSVVHGRDSAPESQRHPTLHLAEGRIALSIDGNQSDTDDFAATPLAFFLMELAGQQEKLAHCHFSNRLESTNPKKLEQIRISTWEGAKRFGIDPDVIFDCQVELKAAIDHLTAVIDASTAGDPLIIVAAGPMEVIWRALNAAQPAARSHVTVVSHSVQNNTKTFPGVMEHDWESIGKLEGGVSRVMIGNQNRLLKSSYEDYHWMRDSGISDLEWLYTRIQSTGKPEADVSDAGLTWWALTGPGDETCSPAKIRQAYRDASR